MTTSRYLGISAVVLGLLSLSLVAADTTVPIVKSPLNGRPVTATVKEPTVGNSKQGDQPVVTNPDEVFTGTFPVGTVEAGTKDGKPVISGRKMLDVTGPATKNLPANNEVRGVVEPDTLNLGGKGEEVGDSTAGGDVAASGHGTNTQNGGTHIQPHGVTGDASAAGKGVNGVVANVNPDGVAGEGSVATVGRR